ncbi:MAG TPA: urea ABC transporter ATP-binding subunit UrtE [Candidatus Tectomicrobia bacterium]|nr:urea ABC transporter ATP-binding subunit UrtE [Candidatus Tectomicrobia bacterium]
MLLIQGLSVGYGDSQTLWDVHLHVPEGQIVCLMGRNGVGKTTLLKSVMGLLTPQTGTIAFDGQDISRVRPEQRSRRGIGYVPQGREIFPQLTVRENLGLGLLAKHGRHGQVPGQVFELFPALSGLLNRRGGFLSGGQQQQLAIARALVTEPKLLLLDEPTEGIQPSIIEEIEEVILRIKAQGHITILLIEQYVAFAARLADAFYMMEKGTIVAHGGMAELTDDVIQQYLTV